MRVKPEYVEYMDSWGGDVRFYFDGSKWRFVAALGEGSGYKTLAQAINAARHHVTPKGK